MLKKIWKGLLGTNNVVVSEEQILFIISLVLAVYHTCLLVLYTYYEMSILMVLNIFSVLLYIGCTAAVRLKVKVIHILRLVYVEIIMQVLAAGIMLGHECGFQFYLAAITCHPFYTGYVYRNDEKVNPLRYVLGEIVAFILLRIGNAYILPIYTFRDPKVVSVLYNVNFFTAVIVLVMTLSNLLAQIIHLEGRLLQKNKDLEVLSHTDALTGLANRRSVEEKYDYVMQYSGMYAVVLGDIDDFKQINDTFGHNIGDKVLQQVAKDFKGCIRGDDMVCRWGGEEILVFLPLCKKDGAELTARRILDRIRIDSVRADDGQEIGFTMTFGVADSGEGEDLRSVIQKADARLYKGKESGKNCIVSREE